MQRFLRITIIAGACLLASSALAGKASNSGSVDKVTGEFAAATCFDCVPGDELTFVSYRLVSAHEGDGRRPQKGFLLSWRDNGDWFEMDFRDTDNTCVNVYADGHARIGGLVSGGNAPQVGRYFGMLIVDAGEPAWFLDHGVTYRFNVADLVQGRQDFLDWCATGDPSQATAVWPNVVIEGNQQVHNLPADGD